VPRPFPAGVVPATTCVLFSAPLLPLVRDLLFLWSPPAPAICFFVLALDAMLSRPRLPFSLFCKSTDFNLYRFCLFCCHTLPFPESLGFLLNQRHIPHPWSFWIQLPPGALRPRRESGPGFVCELSSEYWSVGTPRALFSDVAGRKSFHRVLSPGPLFFLNLGLPLFCP